MPVLFWDIETRSMVSLEDAGAFRYAADPGTEVLVIAYAVDDGEPQTWVPGQYIPTEFATAASDPSWVVVAHNHMFERVVADYVLGPRYGWPAIPITQQRCTMSMALANALPAALENVTQALGLPHQKDVEGHLLMKRMSRPRRDGTYVHGEGERARLALYCKRDVEAERAVYRRLPPLSAAEQALWELDALINARGFHVDVALAKAARAMARSESAALDTETANLTAGEITSVNQVQRIVAFVRRHGHTLQSLTKRNVAALLADNPASSMLCSAASGPATVCAARCASMPVQRGVGAAVISNRRTSKRPRSAISMPLSMPCSPQTWIASASSAPRSLWQAMLRAAPSVRHPVTFWSAPIFPQSKVACWLGSPANLGNSRPTSSSMRVAIPHPSRTASWPRRRFGAR
jgi:DNA polymerase